MDIYIYMFKCIYMLSVCGESWAFVLSALVYIFFGDQYTVILQFLYVYFE